MLLAFDTATPQVAVAVYDDTTDTTLSSGLSADRMRHTEQVAPMIAAALAEAGVVPADLTAVVVGVGPGPFTGLRVGIVTARTLGLALELPVYGICSLDALAARAAAEAAVEQPFVVATDARRKEVYWAAYQPGEAGPERIAGPAVDKPAGLLGGPCPLPEGTPVLGEGTLLYPDQLTAGAPPLPPAYALPDASWLARLVTAEAATLYDPEPLYLRRPDAVARPR